MRQKQHIIFAGFACQSHLKLTLCLCLCLSYTSCCGLNFLETNASFKSFYWLNFSSIKTFDPSPKLISTSYNAKILPGSIYVQKNTCNLSNGFRDTGIVRFGFNFLPTTVGQTWCKFKPKKNINYTACFAFKHRRCY